MKSSTDQHWNERAASVQDDVEVNIMDVFQRELEYDHVSKYLARDMTVLEIGCGNGFSTARFRPLVKHIDAFDYAENMIERARSKFGEMNNRFLHDNLLDPKIIKDRYDTVICIRVLINLRNLHEQKRALDNIQSMVKENGLFILAEGFTEGFAALSRMRGQVGLPPLEPAKINFYSTINDLLPVVERHFECIDRFHLGAYDYLTRVVYPLIVGAENARHNSVFSEKCALLAKHENPESLSQFSRMRGFVFKRRP